MNESNDHALVGRIYSWLVIALTGTLAVFVFSLAVIIGMNLVALFDVGPAEASEGLVPSPTATSPEPTPTAIAPTTIVQTATTPGATPDPTATPVEPTPVPPMPTPALTETPTPVSAQAGTSTPTAEVLLPTQPIIDDTARWIDVDLSEQRLTAYAGKTPVKSYLVSTGLPQTPTPVGQYAIWIKLRCDDMVGADYYIKDVPYVMYFHEGYGLHGVTWHANFGHRMSHGCVNQPNDMAEWLFSFADVGTMVNIHE